MSEPFPPRAIRRHHAKTVRDSSSRYKIDYVIVVKTFLNPKGHQNCISGSKVMALLLKERILPIGGASAVEGLRSTGLPLLVFIARECCRIKNEVNLLFCPKNDPLCSKLLNVMCRHNLGYFLMDRCEETWRVYTFFTLALVRF